ncbi:hypothetical protein [Pseudomonas sp. NW5]|uniref:hypothetical protein n=1 Tax=Pseudomonas sp. NW5 TaxID=2934934 RepID=UPI00201FCEA1|nr:hypothetical protein [Pseudomonas sp. NW5]MCL7462066.1 hypothetical protein [Pseudomonas sp. NW5]
MHTNPPSPLRQPCPPALCTCGHRTLLADATADQRILRLTRHEERRLLARLQALLDFDDLQHLRRRMHEQLGIELRLSPGLHEVRSARGVQIDFTPQPGLCRKTQRAMAATLRRAFEQHPPLLWRLLDSFDLLGA